MISVNKELRSVIGQQKADVKLNINPLSMKLQGIVEAAVQGGTANYEKVLLSVVERGGGGRSRGTRRGTRKEDLRSKKSKWKAREKRVEEGNKGK